MLSKVFATFPDQYIILTVECLLSSSAGAMAEYMKYPKKSIMHKVCYVHALLHV